MQQKGMPSYFLCQPGACRRRQYNPEPSKCLLFWALSPFLTGRTLCSPNILRTVRRTIIRFLIELLVRRSWFGQFDELCFVLNWLIMRCKLRPRTCGRSAADSIIQFVGLSQISSSQYTIIIPLRVIQLTTMSFWSQRQGCASHKSTKRSIPSEACEVSTQSSIFSFISSSFTVELSLLSTNQRQCSPNWANIPRTC